MRSIGTMLCAPMSSGKSTRATMGYFRFSSVGSLGPFNNFSRSTNLDHAVARVVVSQIHAIAFGSGRKSSVQASRRGAFGSRFLPRQTEIANEHGFRGIAQIVNLHHARRAPAHRAGDQIRDAGVAFPPILMSVAQAADDHGDAVGLGRVGHIPDFMRAVAEIAQQIKLAFVAMRQVVAAAHAHHGRAAEFARAVFRLARECESDIWDAWDR